MTCGAAIDVPLIESRPLPVPRAVDTIVSPGAAMSGLTPGLRVSREVNPDGVSVIVGSMKLNC